MGVVHGEQRRMSIGVEESRHYNSQHTYVLTGRPERMSPRVSFRRQLRRISCTLRSRIIRTSAKHFY